MTSGVRRFETQFIGVDRNAVATIRDMDRELGRLDRTQGSTGRSSNQLQQINGRLRSSYVAQGLAIAGVSVGLYELRGRVLAAISAASALEEAQNKVNVVFGESAEQVSSFSEQAASIGLSTRAALEAAGAFGNMFNTVGLANDQAARMSTTMVELAADMASFNNEDPSAMLERLRSGLAGEAEPLRRFGVLLSAARVESKALELGLNDGTRALTEQEKVMARYAVILEDTAVQQGDFARTSDSLANSTRTLAAEWENLNAELGTFISPVAVEVVGALADITHGANELTGALGGVVGRLLDIPGAAEVAIVALSQLPGIGTAIGTIAAADALFGGGGGPAGPNRADLAGFPGGGGAPVGPLTPAQVREVLAGLGPSALEEWLRNVNARNPGRGQLDPIAEFEDQLEALGLGVTEVDRSLRDGGGGGLGGAARDTEITLKDLRAAFKGPHGLLKEVLDLTEAHNAQREAIEKEIEARERGITSILSQVGAAPEGLKLALFQEAQQGGALRDAIARAGGMTVQTDSAVVNAGTVTVVGGWADRVDIG